MKELDFYKRGDEELVVALGFFDSIHVGHTEIIKRACCLANELNAESAVFTFSNDVASVIGQSDGLILTYDERLKKLSKLNVNAVISTVFTKELSTLSPIEFFNTLTTNYNIKAIVLGRDYRFGYMGSGDVSFMKALCRERNILLEVLDDVEMDGRRVSTTGIKKLLQCGEIRKANLLLGESYSISGRVSAGRQVGRQMGFPTANLLLPPEKAKIKVGVYKTHVILDGKNYNCITNYGARPTFDLSEVLTETYVDGFSGDLYGKSITVYFDEYLRDCVKFAGVEELIKQLQKDLEKIR